MMPSGICAICFIPMFPFPHCLSPRLLFLPSSSFPSFSQLVPTLVFICVYPCLYVCAHVGICGCGHGHVSGTQCVSGDQKTTLGCFSPCLAPCLDKLAYLALFFFLLYMPGQLAHGPGTLLTLPLIPPQEKHCDCRWGLLHQAFLKTWYQGCIWVFELRSLCLQIKCLHTESSSQHPNLNFTSTCIQLSYFLPPLSSFSPSRGHFYIHIHTYTHIILI